MKSILHLKFIALYIIFGFLCIFTTATLTEELLTDRLEEDTSRTLYREATLIANDYLPSYFTDGSPIWAVQSQLAAMRLYLESSLWFVKDDGTMITSSNVEGTSSPEIIEDFNPAEIGGNSGYIGVTEMLRRRNINFLFECDRITSSANLKMSEFVTLSGGIWNGWKNEAEDVAGLKRELGMALTNRLSFWFFNIWGGMYRSPEVRNLIRRAVEVWKTYAPLSTGSAAEILLVIDPDSCYQMHHSHEAWKALLLENRISASGLPADTATWEDLAKMDLSACRMIVFESLVVLSSEKEDVLRKKVCTDGRTVVFLHEAGIIRNGVYAEENVEQLTGIGIREAGTEVHVRKQKDWTMVYAFDADALTKEKLFQLAEEAKVHLYVRSAAFHASGELLSVHCAEGGERVIHLPFRVRRVTEIFDGRVVAENTDTFTDSFCSPGTNIYFFK